MTQSFRWLFIPTLSLTLIASIAISEARADHGIRRSGVHLSHGGYTPRQYNSLSYPRAYVGVPPYHIGTNYHSGYRGGYRSRYSGGYYHDTSHFDYHAPTIYRHYNHYHVVPGHYDYHQSGHWHH